MKYVARWDNGSGYMEWAGRPVGSIEQAKQQVKEETWTDVDVVQVPNGKDNEGRVVARRPQGGDWTNA